MTTHQIIIIFSFSVNIRRYRHTEDIASPVSIMNKDVTMYLIHAKISLLFLENAFQMSKTIFLQKLFRLIIEDTNNTEVLFTNIS